MYINALSSTENIKIMCNQTQTTLNEKNNCETDILVRQYAESYIANRLEAEREYYDNGADTFKKKDMSNHTLIIICGAVIPIITVFETAFDKWVGFTDWHLGSIANAIIAAIIAIIAGIDKLHQTQSRWNIMRYCAQMLRREEMLYRNRVGGYGKKTEKEAKQLLVKRTEDILYYDIASTLQFTQKGGPNANETDNENKTITDNKNQKQ